MFLSVTIIVTTVVVIGGRGTFSSFQESLKQPLPCPSYLSQGSSQTHKPEFFLRLNVGTCCGPVKGLTPHQKPVLAQAVSESFLHSLNRVPPGPACFPLLLVHHIATFNPVLGCPSSCVPVLISDLWLSWSSILKWKEFQQEREQRLINDV